MRTVLNLHSSGQGGSASPSPAPLIPRCVGTLLGVALCLMMTPHASLAIPAAAIDADGDGISDIAASRPEAGGYQIRVALSGSRTVVVFPAVGTSVFSGDLYGDGKARFVAVTPGQSISWQIQTLGEKNPTRVTFGSNPDVILGGCRFISSKRSGLAYMRGRYLFSRDIVTNEEHSYRLHGYLRGLAVGCVDVTGDGIDEILIKTRGRNIGKTNLLALATSGRRVFSKDLKPFAAVGVVRRGESGAILAIERLNPDSTSSSQLLSIRATQTHEGVGTSSRIKITGAILPDTADTPIPTMLWQDGQALYRRDLPVGTPTAGRYQAGTLPGGFTLLPEGAAVQTR